MRGASAPVPAAPATSAGRAPEVTMTSVVKAFGDVQALRGVDLHLRPGEVHALLGENGAGKTTLMRILGGLIGADAGTIEIDGSQVRPRSARDAARLGIGMVHQHFCLIRRLTVAENLLIGAEAAPRVRDSVAHAKEIANRYRMSIDPTAIVADLSVGEQQAVEILRALSRGARILILDEPTAVLTPQEAEVLFQALRELADGGSTVVFISHKLRDVMGNADRITVMRRGSVVSTFPAGTHDELALARLMVGRDVSLAETPTRTEVGGDTCLACRDLVVADRRGHVAVDGLSLEIAKGEIVGLAGVAGNGQRELADALSGLRPIVSGTITTPERELSHADPVDFVDAGIGYVPEDRNGLGMAPSEPIWQNAILRAYRRPPVAHGWRVSKPAAREFATELCELAQCSTSDVETPVRNLSGGNAQRLMLRRELRCATRVLIAAHPTRGLDVGAAETVREALREGRDEGIGVLFFSEDLDEILNLADRVVVIYEGRILAEYAGGERDRDEIGLRMGGVQKSPA